MPSFHPRAEALPEEIPVFPLMGALLLPWGRLPLNIFERRYLAMVEDALAAGRMFGMIQPDPSAPATPNGPGCYRIGCLGRLASFSETDDGRFLITLVGLPRFETLDELPPRRGYRRMRVGYGRFLPDLDPPQAAFGLDRAALLSSLRAYFARQGYDANHDAIGKLDDPALVTTLSILCPFEPAEKQALLEAPDLPARAAALLALLRMGAAEAPDGARPS